MEFSDIQGLDSGGPGKMREMVMIGVPGEGDLKIYHYGTIGGKARTARQTDLIAEVLGA